MERREALLQQLAERPLELVEQTLVLGFVAGVLPATAAFLR